MNDTETLKFICHDPICDEASEDRDGHLHVVTATTLHANKVEAKTVTYDF